MFRTSIIVFALGLTSLSSAQVMVFTNRAAWEAAVSGTIINEGFEGNATGSLAAGTNHDLGEVHFMVTLITATTSGASITSSAISGARAVSMNADDGMRRIDMTFDQAPLASAFGFDLTGGATGGKAVLIVNGERLNIVSHLPSGAGFFGITSTVAFSGVQFGDESPGALPTEIFTLDNASYAAVPEPATIAILGLGALGLFRRRRKA